MKATHRTTLHHRLFILTLVMLGAGLAPDGTLYVGRDNTGSGGGPGDLVKNHRIGPGGSLVVEFGGTARFYRLRKP